MKLPFQKPRSASLDELRAQLGHAENTHSSALAAVEAARHAFYESGAPDAERALSVAREAAQSAFEHLGRAQYLLDKAEEARAAEERRAKEQRRAELQKTLAEPSRDKELTDAVVKACLGVAEAQLARAENDVKLASLEAELTGLEAELGGEKSVRLNRSGVSMYVIAKSLDAQCQALPAGTRRDVLTDLVHTLAPNGVRW